jgi:hypothetical protein
VMTSYSRVPVVYKTNCMKSNSHSGLAALAIGSQQLT